QDRARRHRGDGPHRHEPVRGLRADERQRGAAQADRRNAHQGVRPDEAPRQIHDGQTQAVNPHEQQFAAEVDRVARLPDAADRLLALCDEQHAAYAGQSAPAIARMRGWVLEALGRRPPLADAAIPYVLEELEAPSHPYLLTVAARCLRAAPRPHAAFAAAVSHACRVAPGLDAPVTLGVYGGLGEGPAASNTSPVRELAETTAWL